jgi:threonine/homoserine/homoserine lactone efflux protein
MLIQQVLAHGCCHTLGLVLLDAANALTHALLAGQLRARLTAPRHLPMLQRGGGVILLLLAATTAQLQAT